MIYRYILLLFVLFSINQKAFNQNGFRFANVSKSKERISFKLINNLIVIPIDVNGKKLSFILDTGVNKTIVFNNSNKDSLQFLNTQKIILRGLGNGNTVDAILSKKNTFRLKNIVSYNESVYVIIKDYFDLSSRMGITVHGIIGFNLLKDFVIKINYKKRTLNFYKPEDYNLKKCKKCEILPIYFFRKKPYVDVAIQLDTVGNKLTDVKLLVDSGGSEALWLLEDSKKEIQTPLLYFNDLLGEGLSGPIYGNKSRIPKLKIGRFNITKPTVSFLDSLSMQDARKFKKRNGSIGGNILKRFKIWLDYRNRTIMLKKNGSFNNDFNYNMSGLNVVYNGKKLVVEKTKAKSLGGYKDSENGNTTKSSTVSYVTNYTYKFKSSYKIKTVVKNSPADKAGLLPNDIILRINGKMAHNLTLNDILRKLRERDKKKINILIERNGKDKSYQFRLEKRI